MAHAPRDRVTARMTRGELRAASRAPRRSSRGSVWGRARASASSAEPARLAADRVRRAPDRRDARAVLDALEARGDRPALVHGDVQVLLTVPGFLKHDYLASLRDIVPELTTARPGGIRAAAAPALRRVVVVDGGAPGLERWDALASDVDDAFLDALEARVSPTDVATVFFTSGSTAQAKAVVHAHAGLAMSGRRIAECLGSTPDDAWWGHMPLFWSGGFIIGASRRSPAARARCCRSRSIPAARWRSWKPSAARSWPAGIRRARSWSIPTGASGRSISRRAARRPPRSWAPTTSPSACTG